MDSRLTSARRHRRLRDGLMTPLVLVLLIYITCAGCAIRVAQTEHFVGPIWFRYSADEATRPQVIEVVRFGVAAEMGNQWGVTLGVLDRIAVAPREPGVTDGAENYRWRLPLQSGPDPVPERWHVSWLYARVEGLRPAQLVRRVVYGAEVTAGPEARALSLGVTARMHIHALPDAVSIVRFNSRWPLATRFTVWSTPRDGVLVAADILEEVHR